jgi:hypothetical protein
MKNPLFAFGNCLRHAFMTGAGYGEMEKITDFDQKRWVEYDPPETGSFATMAKLIAGENVVVDGEPPKPLVLHPNVLSGWGESTVKLSFLRGKDLEFMWKSIRDNIPVGSIWTHKGNEAFYRVTGLALNTITDEWDVEYVPLYPCRIAKFTRQAVNHEKAFTERFALVSNGDEYVGRDYPAEFSRHPVEKEDYTE